MNRRKAVAGSILVQAGLGSIISWAMLFTSARGRAGAILAPAFHSEWIITAGLLAFAAAALGSLLLVQRIGSQKVAASSGFLLGVGFFSTAFLNIASIEGACVTTGMLGAAAGLSYVLTIDIGMKWYPEKKGIIAGVILAASGFGGLCWFRLQEILVGWLSLQNTLLAIGAGSAILALAGSFALAEPPAGYVPPVWKKPENPLADQPPASAGFKQILCLPSFYIIAVSMLAATAAATFFSGNLQYVCNKILTARGLEVQLACRITLLATAIFAISDAVGRIAWGAIADNIGFKLSIVILCAVETVLILLVSKLGGSGSILIFGTFVIGTAMGGILTLYPCIVSEYIGGQEFFKTYSLIFALFLISACAIIQASGFMLEGFGANTAMWLNCLFFSSALPLAGGIVMLLLKRPGRRMSEQEQDAQQAVAATEESRPEDAGDAGQIDEHKETGREEDETIQQNN